MSDAYTDMAAIAMALGFSLEEFEETFEENRRRIDELHCSTKALCDIIDDYTHNGVLCFFPQKRPQSLFGE